jgi:hypothetical protein
MRKKHKFRVHDLSYDFVVFYRKSESEHHCTQMTPTFSKKSCVPITNQGWS